MFSICYDEAKKQKEIVERKGGKGKGERKGNGKGGGGTIGGVWEGS